MVTGTVACSVGELYSEHVNPQWVRLLDLLEMNVRYQRCLGSELFTPDGRRILDFLSGYCVHNAGHNHPAVIAAVREELESCGPAMIQTHGSELAGQLGEKLCQRAGGGLSKVFFGSSGSEGVEAAIKFARAHTGRSGLLYADGAFHGLTCGALSLMGNSFWRESFGPLLPDTEAIPFDNLDALESKLARKRFAALILEPIQSEAGIKLPAAEYFRTAQELCRRYGTLLVLDEIQTGMYRTGRFLAAQHFGVDADMVILAKAMSGGLIPVSAVLMTEAVYNSVYGSLRRSIIHTSTYGENGLAMRAALATIEVLESEHLGRRSTDMGQLLRRRLRAALAGFEMVREVRGEGLLIGIEFQAPKSLRLRIPFEAFLRIHPAMFGQILVMRLFRDSDILTQICGNNFMVLKVAPPLVVTEAQIDEFVAAVTNVMELVRSSTEFWSEALGLARRAIGI